MSFIWSEYLDLARELAGAPGIIGSEEAKLRSAISRAYYAAHRTAVQVTQSKDQYVPSGSGTSVHLHLIGFLQSSIKPGQDVAIDLEALRRMRGRAGYQDQLVTTIL